ncbi:hypothetical protein K504DRAFT_474304 [Pleomassaria siparia CBS 279.74]|uniref:CENP-V/GFA domain-containing protein n=1 Tax=Pleomassaria siparia CBS 279.74 TaxID=1314801 RepID=A0A6G1JR97_9PLEO|nr:hypothetical protein K504DRAFT_474304 [Pleomassaria siparia CBS 279.74]
MYLEYNHDGHFEAATGTLQMKDKGGIVDYRAHIWIEDTLDGGASPFITHVNGTKLGRFLQEPGQSEEVPLSWTWPSRNTIKTERTYAHCHCKGVELYISPPNESSKAAESGFAHLLIPHHTGPWENPTNHPWWLPRHDRFLAGTCACISCRQSSGFDLTFWAFIPAVNITQDSSGTISFLEITVLGTFCNICGADIFWDGDWRQGLIDVAVGLLDAPSGARAEELLAWWSGRVSFEEFAQNRHLVRGLEDGLKDWATRNNGAEYVATSDARHFTRY